MLAHPPDPQNAILGIDLGTTYCAVAVVDGQGNPIVLANEEGEQITPSVIHFFERDACVVGTEALKMVVVDPVNVVRFIKRSMGEADYLLEFYGRAYSPQELSGIILRKLCQDASEVLGFAVKDAVITVPAYFDSAQRGATTEAARLAGLNVLSIINEPTAAALSYGKEQFDGSEQLLVFDLGGGTFDVTIMSLEEEEYRARASDGNAELGGKDWDDRLLNFVSDRFYDRFGLDPRDEPQPYQQLYEDCLAAKIALSTEEVTHVPVQFHGRRMTVQVTRRDFEALTQDLVDQCADTCALVLKKAGLTWKDLDVTLLVGGSTHMPMIRKMLRQLTGKENLIVTNPAESVAQGAALAAMLRHGSTERSTKPDPAIDVESRPQNPKRIVDITSHPLGVIALDSGHQECVVMLIPPETEVPCKKQGRFSYPYDHMKALRLEVTEGPGDRRDEVRVVAEVLIEDLPPHKRGTHLDVVYRYDINQILTVDVVDVESQTTRGATVDLRGTIPTERKQEAIHQVRQAVLGSQHTLVP